MKKQKKRRRLGPLPGPSKTYLDTLRKCLAFVQEKRPLEVELDEWFLKEFMSIKSRRTPKDYTRLLVALRLVRHSNDHLELTSISKEFLETSDTEIIYILLDREYVAIHEILELFLEKPSTLEEIASFIERKIGLVWESKAQYLVRLNWLQGLGYVIKSGRYYGLSKDGRRVIKNENEEIEECPTHSDIQDHIVEIGKNLGLVSEKEFKVSGRAFDVVWRQTEEGDPGSVFEVVLNENLLASALERLKFARNRFGRPRLFLVTNDKCLPKAENMKRVSFREIAPFIKILHLKKVDLLRKIAKGIPIISEVLGPILHGLMRRGDQVRSSLKAVSTKRRPQTKRKKRSHKRAGVK